MSRAARECGQSDLFISFRQKDGSWSKVVNMGEEIISREEERFASVSPDGKYPPYPALESMNSAPCFSRGVPPGFRNGLR